MPILPTSCSGAARPDQLDLGVRQPELGRRASDAGAADPPGVLLRVVVAVLGREREALEDLEPRLLEIAGALRDLVLEVRVLLLQASLEHLDLEQVADAQQQLDPVERLGEEVARAQSRARGAWSRGRVGGEDEERHLGSVSRPARPEPLHQLEAVHAPACAGRAAPGRGGSRRTSREPASGPSSATTWIDRQRQPDRAGADHDDGVTRGVAGIPILVGVTTVTELDFGLLRHALNWFWPTAGMPAMIVSLATI